jgi:perosamine synthetase
VSGSGPIQFFHTHISPRAIERATEVLRSTWVNEGEVVQEFEAQLVQVLGVKNPVAVNSGTSALHLALVLSGVGPGDEVILPAQTFVATGMVILMQRATPVFADIDPHTGNLDPGSMASRLTARTKAILPVHWGGYPCDMDEILEIADRSGVTVIEDAAHALGATYRGHPVGSLSRFTAFSFQGIKHLTTGDGGLLCCASSEDARAARIRRWFGIDRSDMRRSILGDRGYDISTLGYKYHMNNLAAAIGLGNLEDFPQRLDWRRQIGRRYRTQLAGVAGLELLRQEADREHAYWLFTVLVERRADFVRALKARGVSTSVVDLRIDRNSIFGGPRQDLSGQAVFDAQQVAIPVHDGLDEEAVESIVEAIRRGW